MENWQLTLVILASVLAGALIPLLIKMAVAFHRAGKEVAEMGAQMKRTLIKVEIISERVEVLSRGFEGGETSIAEILKSVGHIAEGLERNMKTINVISAIIATIGPVVGSFVKAQFPAEGAGERPGSLPAGVPGNGAPISPLGEPADASDDGP